MKSATHEILDRLGVDALATSRGVGRHSIRQIRHRGVFPEAWFLSVCKVARDRGVDLEEICARHGVSLDSLFQVTTAAPGVHAEGATHNG